LSPSRDDRVVCGVVCGRTTATAWIRTCCPREPTHMAMLVSAGRARASAVAAAHAGRFVMLLLQACPPPTPASSHTSSSLRCPSWSATSTLRSARAIDARKRWCLSQVCGLVHPRARQCTRSHPLALTPTVTFSPAHAPHARICIPPGLTARLALRCTANTILVPVVVLMFAHVVSIVQTCCSASWCELRTRCCTAVARSRLRAWMHS
jgi:hypothetical protein